MVLLTLSILSVGLIGCCNCSPLPSTASSSIVGKYRKKARVSEKKNGKINNWTKFCCLLLLVQSLDHLSNCNVKDGGVTQKKRNSL